MTDNAYDIALVRIDNRLVHGQILEAWVPFIKAKCIIVVNDNAAGDIYFDTVIRMAVPREIEMIINSVEDFAKSYTFSEDGGKKTIVLFATVVDACRAYNLGFHFDKLNIGNIFNEDYKLRHGTSVFLCDSEIRELLQLLENDGVEIGIRRIPQERAVTIQDVVKDYCEITP